MRLVSRGGEDVGERRRWLKRIGVSFERGEGDRHGGPSGSVGVAGSSMTIMNR
jgi:hypothetical protein